MTEQPNRDAPDQGVLNPEDLDVEDRDEVDAIGENRYLVSTGEDADDDAPALDEVRDDDPAEESADEATQVEASLGAIRQQYAVEMATKMERDVATTRIASDNIVEVFEEFLLWYASQLDESTPPEEVLRILIAESDLELSLFD
jgi:hypothetical protein